MNQQKSKPFGIIYKSTCLINGKSYIGQTTHTLHYRRNGHATDARRTVPSTCIFIKAIRKYGIENFQWEILMECESREHLDSMEDEMIKIHHTHKSEGGYNIRGANKGKSGFKSDFRHTEEHKQKMRERMLGDKNPMKNHEVSESVKKTNTGRKMSDETRKKMSESGKGRIFTEEHRRNLSLAGIGKNHHTAKTYQIIEPDGTIIITESLKNYCDNNGLGYGSVRAAVLRNESYIGYIVKRI